MSWIRLLIGMWVRRKKDRLPRRLRREMEEREGEDGSSVVAEHVAVPVRKVIPLRVDDGGVFGFLLSHREREITTSKTTMRTMIMLFR